VRLLLLRDLLGNSLEWRIIVLGANLDCAFGLGASQSHKLVVHLLNHSDDIGQVLRGTLAILEVERLHTASFQLDSRRNPRKSLHLDLDTEHTLTEQDVPLAKSRAG